MPTYHMRLPTSMRAAHKTVDQVTILRGILKSMMVPSHVCGGEHQRLKRVEDILALDIWGFVSELSR